MIPLAVSAVIFEEVGKNLWGGEVVDCDDFDILGVVFDSDFKGISANTAKAIDGNSDRHRIKVS